MKVVKIIVLGKIIMSGEHSVVYGSPALLAAIDKKLTIKTKQNKNNLIRVNDNRFGKKEFSFSQIKTFGQKVDWAWQGFDNSKNIKKLEFIKKDNFALFKLAVYECQKNMNLTSLGYDFEIKSEIPISSGMGSSAAIVAGVIAALMKINTGRINEKKLFELSLKVENRQHGYSSGADPSIVISGGLLLYQKGKQIKKLIIKNTPSFLLINSGQASESTGEMVAIAAKKLKSNTPLLDKMEQITLDFVKCLTSDKKLLPKLINKNQTLLQTIGVVGKKAQKIIDNINSLGGSAKICGAGGLKTGSGMILAIASDYQRIYQYLDQNNYQYFFGKISQEGVSCV